LRDAPLSGDKKRQQYLTEQGFQIMRFSNRDVLRDVDAVVATILHKAEELQQNRWKEQNPSPKLQSNFDPPARGG
jgi:very-short-patch-repair endonuclease